MTDQPRLSERLAKAARAIDLSQPYPVYGARMNALYELVLDVAIPDLQALEAREERLTAALERARGLAAAHGGVHVASGGYAVIFRETSDVLGLPAAISESRQEGAER